MRIIFLLKPHNFHFHPTNLQNYNFTVFTIMKHNTATYRTGPLREHRQLVAASTDQCQPNHPQIITYTKAGGVGEERKKERKKRNSHI
jgi:hypothetical protein